MSKKIHIMIGSGEHSIFTNVKKGTRIMINSGDKSTFTTAGKYSYFPIINIISDGKNILYPETSQETNTNFEDVKEEEHVSFVKKLQRKIKKDN